MNKCVLKTFGRNLAVEAVQFIGVILALGAFAWFVVFLTERASDQLKVIVEGIGQLFCVSGMAIMPAGLIGITLLRSLQRAYKECAK